MLRANKLKQAISNGQPVFGVFCSTPAPAVVEMIGCAGFDFVIIDTEHAFINPETLENMLRAGETVDLTTLVRVPDSSSGAILRALDAGAQGIVVPRVQRRVHADQAVRASRYYPYGERGLNTGRSAGFGRVNLDTYIQAANAEIMVVLMIEDRAGVGYMEEVLSVPGIDMILEGAADLSQSLGIPWQTRHPSVKETLESVEATARQHGIPFCAFPRIPDDFRRWWNKGVRTFLLGDERGIAYRALHSHLRLFRGQAEHSFHDQKDESRVRD